MIPLAKQCYVGRTDGQTPTTSTVPSIASRVSEHVNLIIIIIIIIVIIIITTRSSADADKPARRV